MSELLQCQQCNYEPPGENKGAGVQGYLRINIIKRACTAHMKVNYQEDSFVEKPDPVFYSYFSFKFFTFFILK